MRFAALTMRSVLSWRLQMQMLKRRVSSKAISFITTEIVNLLFMALYEHIYYRFSIYAKCSYTDTVL